MTITAGGAVTQDTSVPGRWRVAKKQLASVLQVLLGNRRLLVAEALPEARTLKDELGKFTVPLDVPPPAQIGSDHRLVGWLSAGLE